MIIGSIAHIERISGALVALVSELLSVWQSQVLTPLVSPSFSLPDHTPSLLRWARDLSYFLAFANPSESQGGINGTPLANASATLLILLSDSCLG